MEPSLNLPAVPKAWPFEEAARLAARAVDGVATFETGYGPSGLPHIGTFGEVARTSWVRHAYTVLTGKPSRLIAFSDDMDGLRKVPDNVPNGDMLRDHLNKPLTDIPDPFGTHDSFGAHNNARLRSFLDQFGFDYEFASATVYYKSGRFDAALKRVLEVYDKILEIILPTLGPERRESYAPLLPIHPETGQVMQVKLEKLDLDAATVAWRDPESGKWFETPVTGGHCKCQWKADWAMRWYALGVDYEMSGKDLIDSVKLSGRICQAMGGKPPVGYTYELFLDNQGQKISKSKGNGLSVEDWLRYAPAESLSNFMYQHPTRAKRLFFDVIPKAVDEYAAHAARLHREEQPAQHINPVWHIDAGKLRADVSTPVSFSMLLNLAGAANAENGDILWGFIRRYAPDATPESMPFLARLVEHAVAYQRDFVQPSKRFRDPTDQERAALVDLAESLRAAPEGASADELQTLVFEIGKRHAFSELKAWFGCLYQVLLGQQEGPRFGGFVALYGVKETIAMIESALQRQHSAE